MRWNTEYTYSSTVLQKDHGDNMRTTMYDKVGPGEGLPSIEGLKPQSIRGFRENWQPQRE